ncbi:N-acetylmuramoyl-L-alanine amidase family protein [Clostridium beijerinckii]|uniref:N-acetylmuramoyl-L-alanine amidase family protein n=1 Tax=Clostridium beijerinckii TaxID=1520 RepID=UPI0003D34230|nr:N-acetylmuramoyl-L-alanine amidase family protein [Clostridium beijerinckii]ALB45159.1 N-acetylmuramoyl-L-alanine amidase family protein [Clostridium beijerinckii NRRL B-598]
MLKRINKIISFVTVSLTVFSAMPAMASESTKVESRSGKIFDAIMYKDGKYYIDDDGTSYYYDGLKYNALNTIHSGEDLYLYNSKYASSKNGDYYINLDTGNVVSENISKNNMDNAGSKLRENMLRDNRGRYATKAIGSLILEDDGERLVLHCDDDAIDDFIKIPNKNYTDSWYETEYYKTNSNENGWYFIDCVYTDKDGNYISADHSVGNIEVVTTTDSSVKLKNTKDDDDGYKAAIMQVHTLASDDDYIYRLATLYITHDSDYNYVTENMKFGDIDNPVTVTTSAGAWLSRSSMEGDPAKSMFLASDPIDDNDDERDPVVGIPVIQKISKKQSEDTVNGIKYPESVTTYILADSKGRCEYNAEMAQDNYVAANGKIIDYTYDDNKISVRTLSLKSKNGYSYTDFSDKLEYTIENENCYKFDANGELYILDKGYIKKYDADNGFVNLYKVDEACDNFSVYDENNIIAWNSDNEVYSLISEKKSSNSSGSSSSKSSSSKDDTTALNDDTIKATNKNGWNLIDGKWYIVGTDGNYAKGWFKDATGKWYMLDKTSGVMITGWYKDNDNNWYYLEAESGAMITGWMKDSYGSWYYLNGNGTMATGWMQDSDGSWYYLNSNGDMAHDTYVDGYYLASNGVYVE